MPRNCLYSQEDIRKTYKLTDDHVQTKSLITKYSTNPQDIRKVALRGLDLSGMTRILELGCGYGSFTKILKGLLSKDAEIIGIDMVPENGPPFLSTTENIGYRGCFINDRADVIKSMPDSRFDLVIASYSLYFFIHLINEIARVLKPDGLFVTITHSEYSLQEIIQFLPQSMNEMGLSPPEKTSIAKLFAIFSLENGEDQLQPCFRNIEKIVYKNKLLFPHEKISDCLDYIEKKKTLVLKDVAEKYPEKIEEIKTCFYKTISEYTEEVGQLSITKDDVVFRCYKPNHQAR